MLRHKPAIRDFESNHSLFLDDLHEAVTKLTKEYSEKAKSVNMNHVKTHLGIGYFLIMSFLFLTLFL